MKIDSKKYSGLCSCGKEHKMATRLSVIEPGALSRLDQYMDELGLTGKRCAVYDSNTYNAIPAELRPKVEQEIFMKSFGLHADEHTTADVQNQMDPETKVMLAVGGGPIHDIVRYVAKQNGIPFVSVPTAASCDGFSAEVAAMTWEGVKKTINCQAPDLVVADVNVIGAAPPHLILSGVGDVLGKFIALAEWKIAHALTGEAFCPEIYKIMKDAVDRIWDSCVLARTGDEGAVTDVTCGLLMSGFAMQMFGNSRPASGAEHHVSHLLEIEPVGLGVTTRASHGEKVGVGTLLASEEYHRMAEIEDIAPYVRPYEPIDKEWMREYFGEKLFPATYAENEKDCLANITPEMIVAAWPEIRSIIAEIPTAEDIYAKMEQMGAKKSLEEIGIPEEKRQELLDNSPLTRNRVTLMRLRRMIRC